MERLKEREQIVYSCRIIKTNRFFQEQKRILGITNLQVYNINDKCQIKKEIDLTCITGLTKSTNKTNGGFLMHMSNRHDYRFKCEKD